MLSTRALSRVVFLAASIFFATSTSQSFAASSGCDAWNAQAPIVNVSGMTFGGNNYSFAVGETVIHTAQPPRGRWQATQASGKSRRTLTSWAYRWQHGTHEHPSAQRPRPHTLSQSRPEKAAYGESS